MTTDRKTTAIDRETIFSPCRKYRYTLWRQWAKHVGDIRELPFDGELKPPGHSDWIPSPYLMVIGLNPSTADETKDDPTIRRCIDFAKRWGFGALCMTNLFAWRDTDPEQMKKAPIPVGEQNHHYILSVASGAGLVLAAWGKHGRFLNQDLNVGNWLNGIGVKLHCLRQNKDGSPQHPLYVPAATQPIAWIPK